MSDGIQWMADLAYWDVPVVFAQSVGPDELARRLSVRPTDATGTALRPMTDRQAREVVWADAPRPGEDAAGVVRVGECAGWSFALEYGDGTALHQLRQVSRGLVEAVYLHPGIERLPAMFQWAKDGEAVCSFGIGEERIRQGSCPDVLVPDLIRGGVLRDGDDYARPDQEPHAERHRRTLGILEQRFGLALSRAHMESALLPAFAVRGAPDDGVLDEPQDAAAMCTWAEAQGYALGDGRIPAHIREAYRIAHRI
ncbi:DUF6461 domain-containing protein [Streptomyces sp. NPDC058301]|uniref:DUF6461 domain-containing protein n=1 Tax=Streptomyces sp. NPDC058301 TaxID=3346436 RepID=UPI0036E5B68D